MQKFIVRILKRKKKHSKSGWFCLRWCLMFIMESSVPTTHDQCKSETVDDGIIACSAHVPITKYWFIDLNVIQEVCRQLETYIFVVVVVVFRRRGNWPSAVACATNVVIPTVCVQCSIYSEHKSVWLGILFWFMCGIHSFSFLHVFCSTCNNNIRKSISNARGFRHQ